MNSSRLVIIASVCVLLLAFSSAGCTQKPAPMAVAAPIPEAQVVPSVISELTAATQVPALGETQIVCQASGGEGENLIYSWTSTGGKLVGSGSTVSWTAPQKPGDYMVTVTVTDSSGGTETKNIVITVPQKPNKPPVITAITFTQPAYPPITVKPNMTDEEKRELPPLTIRNYETADLSCMASQPDNSKLDYTWQATGGKLVGTGANIQWIAAGEPGTYIITVDVSDDNGGTAEFSIPVIVHCCSG